jgi:LDH2 family malate/lactate/ureidoglycolate dehydrogenase
MADVTLVSVAGLHQFFDQVLAPHHFFPDVATALKEHLIQANLWGIDSHGLQQIIGYDKSLNSGRINPQPKLTIQCDRLTLIRIEADRSPGQYAAKIAMEQAITQAQQFGIAAIGVTNSNHFGMAGYYTRMAAAAGMIGFATSDTNVVDLAPYGGKVARLGNNPLSWAVPCGDRTIVLDMAAGVVSGGKIKHFAYQGLPIPMGWGLTAAGEITADPQQAVVNLPESYKGAGLALIADLLCGPLLGTTTAMFKTKGIHDVNNGTGHFFWVLDVAAFTDRSTFEREVQQAILALHETPRLNPNQPIYYPGELEELTQAQRSHSGIPIPSTLLETLRQHFGAEVVALIDSDKTIT